MTSAPAIGLITAALLALAACHDEPTVTQATPGEIGRDTLALACAEDRTCPDGGTCDPTTLRCVMCESDADCPGGLCDPGTRACVQCVVDDDCDSGACHPTRNVCVRCWQDAHCEALTAAGGAGVCHPDLLSCVECLSDRDCPGEGARCNLDTFGCVGGCTRDAQCDDNDPCTADACADGACGYTKVPDCGCPDVALACPTGSAPTDSNQDGCLDACLCEDGEVIRPGGTCPCPEPPSCPVDTTLVDADRDGCADACACKNGALVGPDGTCPCPSAIACEGGLVASDLDGDGCPETCTKPCAADCDCEAQGLVATVPCPLACAQCGPFLVCADGVCQGRCGVDAAPPCECPEPPKCGPLETAVDEDLDGCNDACACLVPPGPNDEACGCPFVITCDEGALPIDKDLDGCDDDCVCEGTGREPGPDGSCCEALTCPPGTIATDTGGTSCDDVCLCADGSPADPSGFVPACPCRLTCDGGALPKDTDADGCPDTCLCEDGGAPGPSGCEVCLKRCDDVVVPERGVYVDVDEDGCYDLVETCPVGEVPATSPGAGCPDTCVGCPEPPLCPARATAIDTDGDNCADACACSDGQPAPVEGCQCPDPIVCAGPATAIDRDLDGCSEGCAVSCTNACDCASASTDAAFEAPACAEECGGDCKITSACVQGFCAYACDSNQVVTVCAIAPGDAAVCGCDDLTYPSACEADKAGIAVKRQGACETSGCTSDADCADGELCEAPTGTCPVASGEPAAVPVASRGECQPIPASCVGSDEPVCGCDGKTYTNDCERRKSGVARAATGTCDNP